MSAYSTWIGYMRIDLAYNVSLTLINYVYVSIRTNALPNQNATLMQRLTSVELDALTARPSVGRLAR